MKDNNLIYLDNAAAMPVNPEVIEAFKTYSDEFFANPESVHSLGRKSYIALKEASENIISLLTGINNYSLLWTSSATEAINIAFSFPGFADGVAITTEAEHPAMYHSIEKAGFCEIRKINLQNNGLIDLNDLDNKLDEKVKVVAIHHVQNETGAIQDLVEIRKFIDKVCPNAVFVVDTVQSVAKLAISWKEAGINIGFIGGHKIGAPAGGAMIYDIGNVNKSLQQSFLKYLNDARSVSHSIGRPDPVLCLFLTKAVKKATADKAQNRMTALNEYAREKINAFAGQNSIKICFPVPIEFSSPYIITMLLPPCQGDILVRMLSDKGVMVSAGSACEASKNRPNRALMAMGISYKNARTAVRISFSPESSENDVDRFVDTLRHVLNDY